MEQLETFSNILRWLRYVLEYRLSATCPESKNKEFFFCPMDFPKVTKNNPITNPIDIINLPDYAKAGKLYQKRRKDFKEKLVKTKPGFYLNFLSNAFLINVLKKYASIDSSINIKIEYLYLPGLDDEKLKSSSIPVYKSQEEFEDRKELMRKTGLFLTTYYVKIFDGIRTMSVKCYENLGVVVFWEPSFSGNIPKNRGFNFFKEVAKTSYKDVIAYDKKGGEIVLKA